MSQIVLGTRTWTKKLKKKMMTHFTQGEILKLCSFYGHVDQLIFKAINFSTTHNKLLRRLLM